MIQTGQTLSGYYVDARDSSDSVTGMYAAGQLTLRMNVAGGILTLEGTVDDERHAHGFIKNERLGGNFPMTMIRYAYGGRKGGPEGPAATARSAARRRGRF